MVADAMRATAEAAVKEADEAQQALEAAMAVEAEAAADMNAPEAAE